MFDRRYTPTVDALLAECGRLREQRDAATTGLRLIRDGRCECGGRFKWSASQLRCEQCAQHAGEVPDYVRDIARAALAAVGAQEKSSVGAPSKNEGRAGGPEA